MTRQSAVGDRAMQIVCQGRSKFVRPEVTESTAHAPIGPAPARVRPLPTADCGLPTDA